MEFKVSTSELHFPDIAVERPNLLERRIPFHRRDRECNVLMYFDVNIN